MDGVFELIVHFFSSRVCSLNCYLMQYLLTLFPFYNQHQTTTQYIAPIVDLRKALLRGYLGDLNPFPWAIMTGNCLGWVVYGYYLDPMDPFIVAANIPGLVFSIWLNSGAAKLQYQEMFELKQMAKEQNYNPEEYDDSLLKKSSRRIIVHMGFDDSEELRGLENASIVERRRQRQKQQELFVEYHPEHLVVVPQERTVLRVMCIWTIILIWVGWIGDPQDAASTTGIFVNLNLVFWYGAPLKTMKRIMMEDYHSNSIHRPTMYMNWACTIFSILYGLAKMDMVLVVPNVIGLILGLAQGLLCFLYPRTSTTSEPATTGILNMPDKV